MKIECTLSARSLTAAARQLKEYAQSIQGKTETLVNELGDYGMDSAANSLGHVDTGETLGSLEFQRAGTKGTISVGGAAVWIEFGTGITRNKSRYPHPKAQELGMDAIGTYGKGHGSDPNGWWYPSEYGYSHTYGIECNPFMYNASQDMRRELADIAREVFGND